MTFRRKYQVCIAFTRSIVAQKDGERQWVPTLHLSLLSPVVWNTLCNNCFAKAIDSAAQSLLSKCYWTTSLRFVQSSLQFSRLRKVHALRRKQFTLQDFPEINVITYGAFFSLPPCFLHPGSFETTIKTAAPFPSDKFWLGLFFASRR